MFKLTEKQAVAFRAELLKGPDRNVITDVGYFLIWYSTVELTFTNLLAFVSGMRDLTTFDILSAGMDMRVKIERFRRIQKKRGGIGPNLDTRLTYLDQKCRPIRNRLAHCAVAQSEKQAGCYLASTLSTMPWKDLGEEFPEGITYDPPVTYSAAEILGWGSWLVAFAHDLSQAFNGSGGHGVVEIENPRSPAP